MPFRTNVPNVASNCGQDAIRTGRSSGPRSNTPTKPATSTATGSSSAGGSTNST
jgi:hypothetical protein